MLCLKRPASSVQADRVVSRPERNDNIFAIHCELIAAASQVMKDGQT
jgi:hypothetical protein